MPEISLTEFVDFVIKSGTPRLTQVRRIRKRHEEAYKRFLGRKQRAWFEPHKAHWEYGTLRVRVNPELGLTIDGDDHLIKLYFKDQKLTKDRVAVISQMMIDALGDDAEGQNVALLDVRNSRLHVFDAPDLALKPLLEGKALAFCRMYEGA